LRRESLRPCTIHSLLISLDRHGPRLPPGGFSMRADGFPRLHVCLALAVLACVSLLAPSGCSQSPPPPLVQSHEDVPPAPVPEEMPELRDYQYDLTTSQPTVPDFAEILITSEERGAPPFLPGGAGGRTGTMRLKLLREGGGNSRSEAAVAMGLKWLARHQGPAGRWSFDTFAEHGKCNCTGAGEANDVLATGYALLPFLGAGETHKGTGRNHLYSRHVERGLQFLVQSERGNGRFPGGCMTQAVATMALCDAYALTADPALKGPAQRAIQHIVATQRPDGGWSDDATASALPVAAWSVLALKSGHIAGLSVPNSTWQKVNAFLDSRADKEGGRYGISAGPDVPGQARSPDIATAAGLLCRQHMGWGPRNVALLRGIEHLRQWVPKWEDTKFPAGSDLFFCYFTTQVLYQMGNFNPDVWEQWNPRIRDCLIDRQDPGLDPAHRDHKGSWSPEGDAQLEKGGRVLATSLALLILETYYRHLPLYRREIGALKDEGIANAMDAIRVPGPIGIIPPPPGFGGNTGQGGGNDSAPGSLIGFAGGMGGRSGATREKLLREGGGSAPPVSRTVTSQPEKEPEKPGTPPLTWRRERRAPTFARVYIGDGNALELVSIHVSVTVEGPRARTFVDHIFHNPHNRQLEGTFEYPLPAGASPSFYAMFLGQTRNTVPPRFTHRGGTAPLPERELALLSPDDYVKHVNTADWGRLQEGRVVNQQKALETYEEIVRGRIDPALLEYAGGNTFRGRVFPIPPNGFNRVLIAYEELLPVSQDRAFYRYALPDCPLKEMDFMLQASSVDCKEMAFQPAGARREEGGSQVVFSKNWTGKGPGGEAVFAFRPPRPDVQAIGGRQGENGPVHVYARVRPELPAQQAKPFARHAVFLLDTSLSEHPDRFNVNMQLLRKILESDGDIQHFNILAFNVGTAWLEPRGWLPNTARTREQVFEQLDGLVLEGATDFGAALDRLVRPGFDVPPGLPVDVFVLSDGQITWGETEVAHLVSRFEGRCPLATRFHCYRTGLGADNLELFTALTRRGGGIFNVFTEADLAPAAVAHRQQCLQVESVRFAGAPVREVLVAGRKAAVYPGGELIVAGKASASGPLTLVIEGKFLGEKWVREYPIEVTATGELAPRGWAEIAVASLLALNDSNLDSLVTAYCQQFGIASRVASFLVLENPNDYKRLDLEAERGKTVPGGDVGKFLDDAWKKLGKVISAREAYLPFLEQLVRKLRLETPTAKTHIEHSLRLLTDADFELPEKSIGGATLRRSDVPRAYLAARDADRADVAAYLREAVRRADGNDPDGAVRVLSSIIEQHPTRTDALRLVGYRLLDMKQPVHAARLFQRVQRSRPFEPHSYLDLARSLEDCGLYALAAVQYEIVLAGQWDQRFHPSLKQVAREDYARMMRAAIRRKAVKPDVANQFENRLNQPGWRSPSCDLQVTLSWNTDGTDVDLWVVEPDGSKCFYQNRRTLNGGTITDDMTQGYGPERYQLGKARSGEYTVVVHYYSANRNLLGGETHANVVVTKYAGTPREEVQRYTVILKKQNEQAEVCRVRF
jgi:hypothetical protein